MSQLKKWEIEQTANGFRARILNPAQQQPWEYFLCSAVKSVIGIDIPNFGLRKADNQRKNTTRYLDKREIIISFHDENNSAPFRYNIEDVDNQPGWTNDPAGLEQALADVISWCASSGSVLSGIISGNSETPSTVENAVGGAAGSTASGVKGFSIQFEGAGGTLGGVPVDSGYSTGKAASLGNTLLSQAYVVPNVADVAFPNSPRVLIEYVT
ncbi:MAG: hypothetical protein ACTSRU_00670 [Candidatus Hodarchaeales archaeon]